MKLTDVDLNMFLIRFYFNNNLFKQTFLTNDTMSMTTILLFFVYCYGLGFTVSSFVKNSENFIERNLMRLGFGLSLLPFLALVLNIIKIPSDWRIILVISILYPIYFIFKNYSKLDFSKFTKIKITKTNLSIFIMLVIFAVNFYVYGSGAFNYPYLEDDDSWSHAFGVKYVSMNNNVFGQAAAEYIRYINSYPPAYDILLGILHQTNDSIYWTMKFFNALIISLSTIFFYFFVKEFTGNKNKALFAAFALMSIPAFMSHFIWGISLSVPLYFVVFYALERIKHDKKWWIVAALVMVSAFTSSPTHSTYLGIFFVLYYLTKVILERKILLYHALAGLGGVMLSLTFWWVPMIMSSSFADVLRSFGFKIGSDGSALGANLFSRGGTGDRVYTFQDFFIAQKQNMINNPIGIGIFLSLLLIIVLIYTLFKYKDSLKKNKLSISISYIALMAVVLFSLFSTYVKALWESKDQVEPIPFNVFFSDQFFLIVSLAFTVLALVVLVITNYTYKDFKDSYLAVTLVWFAFTFYAVNAGPYSFKLSPFRAWMLLAIPICILAAEGASNLMAISKKSVGKAGMYAVLLILLSGIYFTSTQQKIAVNTANWPPGAFWASGEEIGAYVWMKDNLPSNSKVFTFANNGPVIGMDMFSCHWCNDIRVYMKTGFNESTQDTHNWLKQRNYEYIIIDGQTAKEFGPEQVNQKVKGFAESGLFQPVFQNQGGVIFKVA